MDNIINNNRLNYTQFENYLHAHYEDALTLFDIDHLEVSLSNTQSLQDKIDYKIDQRKMTLNIGSDVATRVLAISKAFQWGNGIVIIPTVMHLLNLGFLDKLQKLPTNVGKTLSELAELHKETATEKNNGLLWGALHLLSLQGWLEEEGVDEQTCFRLTEQGRVAIEIIQKNIHIFQELNASITDLKYYHDYCYGGDGSDILEENFSQYVALSAKKWGVKADNDKEITHRVVTHLTCFLDGLLIGPTLIALAMPFYKLEGGRLVPHGLSIFQQLMINDSLFIGDLDKSVNTSFLRIACDLLQQQGIITFLRASGTIQLTAWGRVISAVAPPLVALPASYLKTYECLDEMLVGNSDPLGISNDQHIDRTMNVWGSSGAGSGPALKEIKQHIIHQLFNDKALEEQPYGIADIGCGDGTSLKQLAEYIINNTIRGKHLDEYPLYVVGADFNNEPLAITRKTLAVFECIEGVLPVVIRADVTDPAEYNTNLLKNNLPVKDYETGKIRALALDDLLHTFMFLIHNRRLKIRDKQGARDYLHKMVEHVDKKQLEWVMKKYFSVEMEVFDDAISAQIATIFQTSFADENGLVPSVVAGVDLIAFFRRWSPWTKQGFIALEGHSPQAKNMIEGIPENDAGWMRTEKLPHVFNWGMHFPSRQYMLPFSDYMLAATLAGLKPTKGKVYGRIHPEGIPGLDLLDQYRFFSIIFFQ